MKRLTTLLFIGFLVFSCKDETPEAGQKFIGTWDWVSSYVGGIVGTNSPASVHYTMKLVLGEDHSYKLYKSDTLIVETTFTPSPLPPSTSAQYQAFTYGLTGQIILLKLDGDALTVASPSSDFRFATYYSRHK